MVAACCLEGLRVADLGHWVCPGNVVERGGRGTGDGGNTMWQVAVMDAPMHDCTMIPR